MRAGERGSMLLIAMVMLLVITLLAVTALRTSELQSDLAGNQYRSERALHIAEAGIHYGLDRLRDPPFNLNDTDTQLSTVIAMKGTSDAPQITSDDLTCNDDNCPLFEWYELTTGADNESVSDGRFRVAFTGVTDTGPLLVRSLGVDANGARKAIEVMIDVD